MQCATGQVVAGHWQHEPPAPEHAGAAAESAQGALPAWSLFPHAPPLYPSVYQPPPFNRKELMEISFRTLPPHSGHTNTGASAMRCCTSKIFWHPLHSYSYTGMTSPHNSAILRLKKTEMLNIGNCNVSPAACQHPRQDNLAHGQCELAEKIHFSAIMVSPLLISQTRSFFINRSIQPPFSLFIFTTTA